MYRISWLDREALTKRIERTQKENMLLQHKIDELLTNKTKKDPEDATDHIQGTDNTVKYQVSKHVFLTCICILQI